MRIRTLAAVTAVVALALAPGVSNAGASPAQKAAAGATATPSGSFALSGAAARSFVLPADMTLLHTDALPGGRTSSRYQQMVGAASVFSGQITVIRNADGVQQAVIGAYFPGITAKNSVKVSSAQAKSIVAAKIGARGTWRNELRLDPLTGSLFYEIDSIRSAQRPVRWVNAGSGAIIKAFNALAHQDDLGVKGDYKDVDTTLNPATGLYELLSLDTRQKTLDLKNRTSGGTVMTDADDTWDFVRANRSPSQPAGVDAHYYANVVDDFYFDTFGRDSIDDNGMQIVSRVHYSNNYCNAFWNGLVMTYGDGDGRTCLPLSGGLDVDGHELTHGVTEHTSNLVYENEPGALNEAFSDMMGDTIEFYAADLGLEDPAYATPDWRIGEDIYAPDSAHPGFRNMADPGEFGDPDHYVDLYTGTADNGGVHTNSGIANHAYYLTLQGGSNAGCVATADRAATHTEDCGVVVPAVGLTNTAQIYYAGFTSLPEYANFCDARGATVASATALSLNATAVGLAWDAVGVHTGCTPATPLPPPCEGSATATIPFESPHPYGNNGDCTWTYDNGSTGFTFHFSLLDTEKNYDYVYVKDGAGNVLATYTGTYRRGATSPCIPTSTGSVQLVTDPSVVGQGLIVDSVAPC